MTNITNNLVRTGRVDKLTLCYLLRQQDLGKCKVKIINDSYGGYEFVVEVRLPNKKIKV